MSRPGRPPREGGTTYWKIALPKDLAARVEYLMHDPMTDRVRYGWRAKVITDALRLWLNHYAKELEKEEQD